MLKIYVRSPISCDKLKFSFFLTDVCYEVFNRNLKTTVKDFYQSAFYLAVIIIYFDFWLVMAHGSMSANVHKSKNDALTT